MSTSYTALSYLGMQIDDPRSFFCDVVETVEQLCGHPSEGHRFCPQCGREEHARTRTHKTWKLKEVYAAIRPRLHVDWGEAFEWQIVDWKDIFGLRVYEIADYGQVGPFVLGLQLGAVDSCGSQSSRFEGDVTEALTTVEAAFAKLGIDVKPSIFTHLSIC